MQKYPDKKLSKILILNSADLDVSDTVMEIVKKYNLKLSDSAIELLHKETPKELHNVETVITGSVRNLCNAAADVAEKLFDDMISFANYAFNKSHAAAYSVISYRTAYLKAHYPKEYFAALLTSVLGNMPKIAEYISDCSKLGIGVLPPDINKSEMYFHVCGKDIRSIKNG